VLGFASRPRERRAASSLRRRCANGSAPSARAGSAGPASSRGPRPRRARAVGALRAPPLGAPPRAGSARLRLAPARTARGLGAAPSLRERLRAVGARRVGWAGFAGHSLQVGAASRPPRRRRLALRARRLRSRV